MFALNIFPRPILLIWLLAALPAVAAGGPDLLFNCELGGQKRPITLEAARSILWDTGRAFEAIVTTEAIEAQLAHSWSSGTRMRHRIRIGRQDHTLLMEVDEINEAGEVVNNVVREQGRCAAEKIHPRNFIENAGAGR
jgi:hypothetical protein